LLYACSGGGGSGGAVPPATVPASSTSTVSAPTPVPSPYPASAADTFVYSGQLQQAFQSFPELAPPSASPEPISQTITDVTQTVSVRTNQTFNGTSGLTDLHAAESDALSTGLKTTTSTTDTYESVPTQSGASAPLLGYGSQFADEAGDTTSTLLSPAAILDQLPETAGAQWSNGAGATIDEALAGDSSGSAVTVVRTVNADGSYSESTTYPPNYSLPGFTGVGKIQENADGSGVFSFQQDGSYSTTLTYSKPEPQPSGPPLIVVNVYAGENTTVAPTQTLGIPLWYGNTPTLYNETDLDQGMQPIPASCNLASSLPSQGTALAQTITRTDTVLGYTEQETSTTYVAPGYGVLCSVATDKQTLYYDFNGDQASVFTATPPFEITTVSETLALQPSSVIVGTTTSATSAATKTSNAARSTSTVLAAFNVAPALRANFERAVQAAHRNRAARLAQSLAARRAKGGTL
jgi:hypothetical protein